MAVPKRQQPKSDFAIEMEAIAEERHRAHVGDFEERWAKRLEQPLKPIFRSTSHHHTEQCLGAPHQQLLVAGQPSVTVRTCSVTRGHYEVRDD